MDNISWFINKLPIPFVLHNKATILCVNAAFTHFLMDHKDLEKVDFNQWVTEAILLEKDSKLLVEAINNHQDISIVTDGHVKGVVYHWTIHSFQIPTSMCQITWLQDSSSAYVNKSYWDLHLRVSKASMQLIKEIADRKKAEEQAEQLHSELVKTQQNLITTSHQAGMAEVAISVMHNIGNVLNGAGISIDVLKNNMNNAMHKKITQVVSMLKENESNLVDYFQNNEQGKLLLKYLIVLFNEILTHKKEQDSEIIHLQHQYNVIKEIISAENEASKQSTVTEKIWLSELIDSCIRIILTEDAMLSKNISINKNYQYTSFIVSDKIHLMQLMVNLLKNAKESIMKLEEGRQRLINISIEHHKESKQVEIRVMDNGIGISSENLPKIFTFGFSTKSKGHGFGLHNCAFIVKQLGGFLSVESDGVGKGATFILRLPISNESLLP